MLSLHVRNVLIQSASEERRALAALRANSAASVSCNSLGTGHRTSLTTLHRATLSTRDPATHSRSRRYPRTARRPAAHPRANQRRATAVPPPRGPCHSALSGAPSAAQMSGWGLELTVAHHHRCAVRQEHTDRVGPSLHGRGVQCRLPDRLLIPPRSGSKPHASIASSAFAIVALRSAIERRVMLGTDMSREIGTRVEYGERCRLVPQAACGHQLNRHRTARPMRRVPAAMPRRRGSHSTRPPRRACARRREGRAMSAPRRSGQFLDHRDVPARRHHVQRRLAVIREHRVWIGTMIQQPAHAIGRFRPQWESRKGRCSVSRPWPVHVRAVREEQVQRRHVAGRRRPAAASRRRSDRRRRRAAPPTRRSEPTAHTAPQRTGRCTAWCSQGNRRFGSAPSEMSLRAIATSPSSRAVPNASQTDV